MSPTSAYDVVILGGGAAGLTLALQLHQERPETSLLVLERHVHPVPEAAHKVGESTVEIAGHYLRTVLGLEAHLREHQLNKFGLRMFFSTADNQDIARRVELGHAVCPPYGVGTYQLDRGRLENALGEELRAHGIEFRTGCRVQDVILEPEQDVHRLVVVTDEGAEQEVAARWVIDATGRTSTLKRKLGLAKKVEHSANAVWLRVEAPIDVDDWSDDLAWHARISEGRREMSTNHLMGPGYWVWLIRLASGGTSIGIVTDGDTHPFGELNRLERAVEWLHEHEPQCARAIEAHLDAVQDFRVMRDYSYSAEQVFSHERWCLAGEAGVFLDPLYSPGLDLIAISNGLITDLICHGLDGEEAALVKERAAIHNTIFLTITDGWFGVYDQQYSLMDNARIMTAKVVWDTAVYWSVPGLLYFQGMIPRLSEFPGIFRNLARFSSSSDVTQRFFREWHALETSSESDAFIGFYDFDFMARLHIGMTADLSDTQMEEQFATNVRFIQQLSGQLIDTVMTEWSASDDGAKHEQVRRWHEDDAVMGLVGIYEQDRDELPTGDTWITLRGARRPRQAVLR